MIKTITLSLTLICLANSVNSQTGPGGIGSASNVAFWFDANTLSLSNGAAVSTWPDKSGNGIILNQNGTTTKPAFRTNQSNGFPSIDFDGTNDHMKANSISAFNGDQTLTYMLVMRPDNTTQAAQVYNNGFSLASNNLQGRLHGGICSSTGEYWGFGRTASSLVRSDHINSVAYRIQTDILTSSNLSAYTNGSLINSNNGTLSTPATHTVLTVGRRPFLNDLHYNGKIAEFIAFSDAINNTERIIAENYLSSKYNITMSANDHYAMEGTGHYFEVAGIGQEGGNSVTNSKGTGRVRISNASALADGDYLMWGHDNASLTSNSVDVPAAFLLSGASRLNRVWRMDETVDVGTYDLSFDYSSMPSPDPSNTVIIIDDDGDFSNGGTTTHNTGYSFNALTNEATWTGVDITDGYYFTVATVTVIFSVQTGPWSDPDTWSCTCVPTSTNDVLISDGDVVTVDASETVKGLAVAPTGTLLFDGGNDLTISGYLDNLGTVDGTNGVIIMAGAGLQTISTNSNDILLETFEVNTSTGIVEIISGNVILSSIGTYFPTDGELSINGGNFIIDSDASGSGRIDEFNSGSFITGNVTFRRFIPAGTGGYRDLAVPFVGGSTVSQFDDDMFISGETSNGFNDGCAYDPSGCFASFKFFEGNTYIDITTAATVIPNATNGVHAYVADVLGALNGPIIIDLTGTVNGDGDIVASASGANTFTLIGNPYISQIDFDELALSNIGDFYYVWDVDINNYNWYQTGNGSSPLTEIIASGQGFVVMPETGFGEVTFSQPVKSDNSATFIRNHTSPDFFRLSLNDASKKFGCHLTFNNNDEASNRFDKFDVPTPYGLDTQAVYISAIVDDRIVRCFGMNNKETSVSVPVMINVPDQGLYTLNTANLEAYDKYSCVILEDLVSGSRYDLRRLSEVRFNMENTRSEEARFMVHLSNDACSQQVAGIDINDDESLVEMTNFNDYVKVDMNFASNENVTISIYNMLGQNVLSEQHQNVSKKSVNITIPATLKNGVYLVVVESDKKRYTRKYNF